MHLHYIITEVKVKVGYPMEQPSLWSPLDPLYMKLNPSRSLNTNPFSLRKN